MDLIRKFIRRMSGDSTAPAEVAAVAEPGCAFVKARACGSDGCADRLRSARASLRQ
jgi:hypothetical protein